MFKITVLICILGIISHSIISGAGNRNVHTTLSPINAVVFEPLTIICSAAPSEIPITMTIDNKLSVIFKGAYNNKTCDIIGTFNVNNTYVCSNDSSIATYNTTIPGPFVKDHLHSKIVKCTVFNGPVNETEIYVHVPISSITISPTGINQRVHVQPGRYQNFSCTTDFGRPPASIQWSISENNVTNQSTQASLSNGTSSTLFYVGNSDDHKKMIYCEAANIKGREALKSKKIELYIISPVTYVSIDTVGDDKNVSIVAGRNQLFTCKTGPGRPAALIEWYIGEQNVTELANTVSTPVSSDSTMFVSNSTLVYIGNDSDHNGRLYCVAVNQFGGQTVSSDKITIEIYIPVTSLTITPVGINDTLKVATGQLKQIICKSNPIRPAAKIEWYIDRQNVTNQAKPSSETDVEDRTKFISTSTLSYTGNNSNHRKVVYCEAVDIGGKYKIKSKEKELFIILPIKTVTINQGCIDNKVSILIGANLNFTCKTGLGRPAAFIRWYIGDENVTNLALTASSPDSTDNTTFKSTSTLIYTGNNNHHNKTIYCEASNFEGRQGIKSEILTLWITVPVLNVYFEPQNGSKEIRVAINQTETLTCRTNACRPPARINWFIGERNVTSQAKLTISLDVHDNTKYISTSTFRYTGIDSDHDNVIRCEAVNTKGEDNVKMADKLLFILVSISTVTLTADTASSVVYVKSNRTHTFTCKTSQGRPTAWINWYIGNENVTNQAIVGTIEVNSMFVSNSTIIYSGDDTDHSKEVYCEAGNVFDSRTFTTDKKTLYIIVPVTKVTLVKPLMNESVTVISGNDTNFTCETGKSRPGGLLHWYVNGQNVTDQAIPKLRQNGTKFIARSTLPYLARIRDHNHDVSCEAFDIYNYGKNVSDKMTLHVLSSPTAEGNQSLNEKIFVGTNEEIELTVVVLANPTPEANWTFTNKTGHDYDISGTNSNVSSLNTFRHVIRYKKENPQRSDYGNYTIQASNNVGTQFVHTFVVEHAQIPSKPKLLNAVCDKSTPYINVSWKSNFDGGNPQTFRVYFITDFTENFIQSSDIFDKGQTEIHFHIQRLDYETNYNMYVQARNKYGQANSSDLLNCTTSKGLAQDHGSPSAVIGGVAGSFCATVIVALVAVVFFLCRHKQKKGDDKQHLNRDKGRNAKDAEEDEDTDGLKNNPLYITTEISARVDVHTQANKHMRKAKGPSLMSDKNEKSKKQPKGLQKKEIELDVYENSEDIRKVPDKSIDGNVDDNGFQIRRNKYGLIYADLDFGLPESRGKFVIIGSENRTDYAMIDLTKKAAPLPNDSDEEVEKQVK